MPHTIIDQTTDWINAMMETPQNGISDFIICLNTPDQRPIGKIGVWQGNEIGFILARQHWRKGLASEALTVIISYLFNQLDLDMLTADIDPRNAASIGLLKKHGFRWDRYEEHTLEVGGEWVDSLYLKLERQHWLHR